MGKRIENWEAIIRGHQGSGKTVTEYCKGIGIHPNTFYNCRNRNRSSSIVEIKPVQSSPVTPIVLKSKKFMISISSDFDEAVLKSVLKIIGELE